jgi:hypothetical protein
MREDVVAIGRRAASHPWPFIWHLKVRHPASPENARYASSKSILKKNLKKKMKKK